MIHLLQTQYIARMNQLHSLQQEIALFENSGNYQKTIHAYKKYVDFVRSWQNSNALINAYLQMAKYCERMEDRLMASDLYSEAVELMDRLGMDELMVSALQNKISALHFY